MAATRSTTTGTVPGAKAPGGATIIGSGTSGDGPGPEVMSASTLDGNDVVNSVGDDLGKIEDIMLDVMSGRIAYAVLSFGGFLGMGDKLFAVPWSALTLDTDEKRFVLDVPKERLEKAPGFDKNHWPSMADRTWASEVHAYYEVSPYWEEEARDPRRSQP